MYGRRWCRGCGKKIARKRNGTLMRHKPCESVSAVAEYVVRIVEHHVSGLPTKERERRLRAFDAALERVLRRPRRAPPTVGRARSDGPAHSPQGAAFPTSPEPFDGDAPERSPQ
jgi:hypothetical protein